MQVISFFFISLATIFIVLVTSYLPYICVIITILTFIFSEKSHILRNLITYNVSAVILLFFFSFFFSFSLLLGKKENTYSGDSDYRYVQINPQYKIISTDNMPFYIEGNHNIDEIDSIAKMDSLLFGLSKGRYFCLSLENDSLQYDSVFSNLDLPAHCTQENLMDPESYYYNNRNLNYNEQSSCSTWEITRSTWKMIRVPLLLALVTTFILSVILKTTIDKFEKIVRFLIKLIKGREKE